MPLSARPQWKELTTVMNRVLKSVTVHVTPINLLAGVGVASLAFTAGWIGKIIYQTYIYNSHLTTRFQTKENDGYALVTGATNGIGEGYAYELAKRGFNLILVSRNETKLRATADAILQKYPSIKIVTVRSEASSLDEKDTNLTGILAIANQLPVTLLVNNVGVMTEELLENTSVADIDSMLNVNCRYGTLLTRALIPLLKKHRDHAGIIMVASQCGVFHLPYLTVYSATKAFNIGFGHALREELMNDGVEVFTHIPSRVVSNLSGFSAPAPGVCSAEETARGALDAVGLRDHAGWSLHQWLMKIGSLVPANSRGRMAYEEMKAAAIKRAQKKSSANQSESKKD